MTTSSSVPSEKSGSERDGNSDQEKDGDHEARHSEQAGERCALATRKDRGPGQGELTGEQLAGRPAVTRGPSKTW